MDLHVLQREANCKLPLFEKRFTVGALKHFLPLRERLFSEKMSSFEKRDVIAMECVGPT